MKEKKRKRGREKKGVRHHPYRDHRLYRAREEKRKRALDTVARHQRIFGVNQPRSRKKKKGEEGEARSC